MVLLTSPAHTQPGLSRVCSGAKTRSGKRSTSSLSAASVWASPETRMGWFIGGEGDPRKLKYRSGGPRTEGRKSVNGA